MGLVSSFSLASHLAHAHIGSTQEPSGGTCISQSRWIPAKRPMGGLGITLCLASKELSRSP